MRFFFFFYLFGRGHNDEIHSTNLRREIHELKKEKKKKEQGLEQGYCTSERMRTESSDDQRILDTTHTHTHSRLHCHMYGYKDEKEEDSFSKT